MEIVRYADLVPCRSAFIDAHTPGSDQKENFTIIGAGVSESPDQHVHIARTPGFNIGGAGQPAKCTNSLHSHRTAEVFIIHTGVWRFFWGVDGRRGEVVLHPGDVVSLPTHMFRGFENVTPPTAEAEFPYGFMFAVLGGDDAGGGVVWAPQVIEAARDHGLVLLESGKLVDTARGETIPEGEKPKPPIGPEEVAAYDRNTIADEAEAVVRRAAPDGDAETPVIGGGPGFALRERPGFELVRWTWGYGRTVRPLPADGPAVVICNAGSLSFADGTALGAGDTAYLEDGAGGTVTGAPGTEAFLVVPTADPPGETRRAA
jgi:hypothetical protein